MSARLLACPLAILTIVLAWSTSWSQTSRLPAPSGEYAVGTVTHFWTDPSRPDALTEATDDLRQVPVQLWYPAADRDGRPAAYMPELDLLAAALAADPERSPDRLPVDAARLAIVRLHATVDPPIVDRVDQFPLVIFSPGGNMSRHWHSALAQDLASRGYVVAVVSHAHSGLDVFPAGGLLRSHPRWDPDEATEEERERLDQERTDMLAADARFVLDRLRDMAEGPLAGRLDIERVAILGHSRGGSTVSRACATDPRFKACVIYDNVGSEPERSHGLAQPMMTMRAAGADWPEARAARVRNYLASTGSLAYEVVLEGSGHFSFTDLPLLDPGAFRSTIEPERAHRLICDYTALFLEMALGGGRRGSLEARAAGDPEVGLTAYEAVSEGGGSS